MPLLALDCETTGLDLRHGARPFFVSMCDDQGTVTTFEWDVDPLTRRVQVDERDLQLIGDMVFGLAGDDGPTLVLHNTKFDVTALQTVMEPFSWPWDRTEDTLIAGHLLASNQPHDLTSMALHYLGIDIGPYEVRLKEAVQKARTYCRHHLKDWRIARKDDPDSPSVKDRSWGADFWLPRAVFLHGPDEIREEHPEWETVLSDYASMDAEVTVRLWQTLEERIRGRKLWDVYQCRKKCLPIAYGMESRGVTLNRARLEELTVKYQEESTEAARKLVNIAATYGYNLELGKGINDNFRTFCFDVMKLEPVRNPKAKTDAPCLDAKNAIPYYLDTLPRRSKQRLFIETLVSKRKRDTALSYMEGYQRFWVDRGEGEYLLHPRLNPTGTDTLRWSSSQPNEQNISKQGMICDLCHGNSETCPKCGGKGVDPKSLRYCFGPAPGREWWSLDAKNIERRLPAYETGEEDIIALFEEPDRPPYYGSEHLLVAHLIFPREFEACRNEKGEIDGRLFKKKYAATLYQDTKNFNFAVQYGAVDKADGTGTADRTIKVKGAHSRVKSRFAKQEAMNKRLIAFANKYGYVETIPDRTVDPTRGYPLLCTRTERGKVLETIPFNYRYQGSAMWWTHKAMVRCEEVLENWRREGFDAWIAMQVHDECVFDLPKRAHPKKDPKRSNLGRIRALKRQMEMGGHVDFGIPTPVGVEYHEHHWSEGITCT